ncbi:MAG: sigma-70 family RNA polymerase sigma factor [Bacteroidetes bacterium]|nr:sigma-70 family RNA polymerase sigma factor [Bacteroidota bacterium]
MPNNPSDKEVIELLKESSDNLDVVYRKHHDYCMNFMKKINYNEELNQDIFHDSLIVLYEKIVKGDFVLSCSIQTFLNSICRNQILVRLKKSEKHTPYSEEFDARITDWYETDELENATRTQAIIKALEMLKELGGKCYEILRRYFYENNSMEKIAYDLEYTNADNVKNQKSRCQKKLKELVFQLLNK